VDFWRSSGEELNNAENAQKIRSPDEAVRGVRATIHVAQEMGEMLG
jgi:hypothetical protein